MALETFGGREALARRCLTLVRWSLVVYALFFPLGITFRELGSIGAAVGLFAYYALDFKGSNLRRFPLRWLLAGFAALLILKTAHSVYPWAGWYALSRNAYKAPILLLASLEAVRDPRHLRRMVWALAAMTIYAGLDGVYQFFNGFDLWGYPFYQRLSAMWPTGRIGNLMSLALPPLFALPLMLPARWSRARRWGLAALIALPGVFLWAGAGARSGWLGMGAAVVGFIWIRTGIKNACIALALGLALVAMVRPAGLMPETIMNAPRWVIWSVALDVFKEYPLLGAGVNCFEAGYKSIGYVFPLMFDPPVPHPHNIYLQFLAETGIVGAVVAFSALFGLALWSGLRIRKHIRPGEAGRWVPAAGFWAAYLGYLVSGLSAHNFYRSWWLGMAMLAAGTAAGAALGRFDHAGDDS